MIIHTMFSEILKLKRSLALRISLAVPSALVLLNALVAYQRGPASIYGADDVWQQSFHEIFYFSTLLALPLTFVLLAVLVTDTENTSCGWKHLYTLPVPRWAYVFSKQLITSVLVGVAVTMLASMTVIAGLVLCKIKPGMGFTLSIPWSLLAQYWAGLFLTSILMAAIHVWIGLRFPGFIMSLGIGICNTFFALVIGDTSLGTVFPWSLPQVFTRQLNTPPISWWALIIGSTGWIIIVMICCVVIPRREIH